MVSDECPSCMYKEGFGKKQFNALITIVIFLMLQGAAALWWASDLTTSMKFYSEQLAETKLLIQQKLDNVYTELEAAKDLAVRDARINDLQDRVKALEVKP